MPPNVGATAAEGIALVQDDFWGLVERVRGHVQEDCPHLTVIERVERYADYLERELRGFEPSGLASFQDWLQLAVAEGYTSGLYAAHYLVNGGGSLDGFYYFRAWLVFQGRAAHRRAIADPDSLADMCITRGLVADYECEDVLNVAKALYEEKTGEMLDWRPDPGDLDPEMPGEPWTDADLPKLLPRLTRIKKHEYIFHSVVYRGHCLPLKNVEAVEYQRS